MDMGDLLVHSVYKEALFDEEKDAGLFQCLTHLCELRLSPVKVYLWEKQSREGCTRYIVAAGLQPPHMAAARLLTYELYDRDCLS